MRAIPLLSSLLVASIIVVAAYQSASADPYPPYWDGGSNPAIHSKPVSWPSEPLDPKTCGTNCGEWKPYTRFATPIEDPRTQDPSNGGTRPQNYVNIASSCIDQSFPSTYYYLDKANQVLMFRWRVEQIANNYAIGPSAGAFGATDPWSSGLWTVFFDLNGDGYRDLAAHLNGSSGDPSTAVDRIYGIWGNVPNNQTLDYTTHPNVHILGHNPTAFVDQTTNRILNFQNSLTPSTNWPNGAAETNWDYGTTRARLVTTSPCNEYFVDYQIPLQLLDATLFGGPKVTDDTPISMVFCTANSLNNPFQKDCSLAQPWIAVPSDPAPFGDFLTMNGGLIEQPIVDLVTTNGCGPTTLTARILDTLKMVDNTTGPSVVAVDYYYYYDANGDGVANDGNKWAFAVAGTALNLNTWTAQWNATDLLRGQYLIGVRAIDDATLNTNPIGVANVTFSYYQTQAELKAAEGDPLSGSNEKWYVNPTVTGAKTMAFDVNACGLRPPFVEKTVEPSTATVGEPVTFTISLSNTLIASVNVDTVSDTLPAGFVFGGTVAGGSLGSPTTRPAPGATGALVWTFVPSVTVNTHTSANLVFTATVPITVGTYSNVAGMNTSYRALTSDPVEIGVGAARLTIAKAVTPLSANAGELVTYTITYANNSPVNVTGAVVSDLVPDGLENVTPLDGGSYSSGTRIARWAVGDLAAGTGPFAVQFTAIVASPFPDTVLIPIINTATITSLQTTPASAGTTQYINVPRPAMSVDKSATVVQVAPGGRVTYTIAYQNSGTGAATDVVITDRIPVSFTFGSSSSGGVYSGGVVTWNVGTVAMGTSGTVTVAVQAANPYASSHPARNIVNLSATGATQITDTFDVGVTNTGLECATYYFHDDTGNVGAAGVKYLAFTTLPQPAEVGTSAYVTLTTNDVYAEAVRFYQDPPVANYIDLTSVAISTTIYVDRVNGTGSTVRGTVYNYDPATGISTTIGSGEGTFGGSQKGAYTFAINGSGMLKAGNRLLWIFDAKKASGNSDIVLQLQFGGTVTNTLSSGTTYATSGSSACFPVPVRPVINKKASKASVAPGETISYTIQFANAGGSVATGARITDVLPAGITFVSASMNGSAITPVASNPPTFAFTATGSTTSTLGVIPTGGSGVLVITGTVVANSSGALTNQATLATNQTQPISATARTSVLAPRLSISKTANPTLLLPGDIVTYSLTLLNSGAGPASNVTVTDVLPVATYFTYLDASDSGSYNAGTKTLTWSGLSLAVGGSRTLTFRMQVASSGVPDGVTPIDNSATAGVPVIGATHSNTATISISTNPNLRITKTLTPTGALHAGDYLTYTLVVSNIGNGDARNVLVQDAIPSTTHYVNDTLVYAGITQTDAADSDQGEFDAVNNRVAFAVGTLSGSASRTMTFAVQIRAPLPAGLTPIDNLATATASNTARKQGFAATGVTASARLSVDKTGPTVLAFPFAKLTAPATNTTTIAVDNVSQFEFNQYVRIGSTTYRVVNIAGNTVTLDANVTAPAGAAVWGAITYAISYRNDGDALATNVRLTDTLPTNSIYVTATSGGVHNSSVVVWSLGSLNPGASGQVGVTVVPSTTGMAMNNVTLASDATTPVTDVVTTAIGGLRLSKSTTTPFVDQTPDGTTATYVLAIANSMGTSADSVLITDTLSAGFTYLAPVAISGGTRSPETPNPALGNSQPVWGTFSIPPAGTLVITFTTYISPSVGPTTYQNGFAVTSSNAPVVPFDELSTEADDVTVRVPVVILSKTVTPAAIIGGEAVTYTVTAYNRGDAAALGTTITDTLPAGFTYATEVQTSEQGATRTSSLAPTGGAAEPAWGVWDISPEGTVTITFRANATTVSGFYSNTVTAVPTNTTVAPLTNVAGVVVIATADLGVLKSSAPNPYTAGQPITYTIVVTSAGPNTASAITVTDILPAAVLTPIYNPSSGVFTAATGAWTGLNLTAGSVVTLTITGTVDSAQRGNLTNTVVVTSPVVSDPYPDNNHDDDVNPQATGTLTGLVFADTNGNGVQNAGEPGLPGVTVIITDSQGITQPVTTDASGLYTATVPAGSTTTNVVESTLPPGAVQTAGTDPTTVTVPAGTTTSAGIDGYQPQGTVFGHIFQDTNGNGAQDAGESNLPNVQVVITDSLGVTRTATTDGSGNYTATVPAGSTTADMDERTLPPGVVQTAGTDPTTVNVPAGSTISAGIDGYQPQGTVFGHLFIDTNGNGVQEKGEPNLSSVQVVITDSLGVTRTTTTDGSGNYTATVPAGSTTANVVESTLPAGVVQTTGSDPSTVNVPEGSVTSAGNDGYQPQGTVFGHIFQDTNGNGVQDAGEPNLPNVQVVITDGLGLTHTATTDGSGNYTATVPGGSTTADVVESTLPPGVVQTGGTDPTTVSVPAGSTTSAGNDGYQPQGTVSGHIFQDTNGNGLQDAGEPGIPGVKVEITGSAGVAYMLTTDANGAYSQAVPAGSYIVVETDPAGYVSTTSNSVPVGVPPGGSATANFGDQQIGTVSGMVWNDLDGDGTQTSGEVGIGSVTVQLMNADGTIAATITTSSDGSYIFTGVAAGSYTVVETDPAGYVSTTSNSVPVSVPPGGSASANFGDQQPQIYDLALTKHSEACLDANANITYTVTVYNQGKVASGAYSIADRIPMGMSVLAASDGGVETNGQLLWSTTKENELAPSNQREFTLILHADDITLAPFGNYAEVYADSGNDQDSTPRSEQADQAGNAEEDDQALATVHTCGIAIKKEAITTTVVAGGDITFTLSLINKGTLAVTNIVVVDQMPTGMQLSPHDANGWTPLTGQNAVSQTYAGPLRGGEVVQLYIVVQITGTIGMVTNWGIVADVDGGGGARIPRIPPSDATIIVTPSTAGTPPTAFTPSDEPPALSQRLYLPVISQ